MTAWRLSLAAVLAAAQWPGAQAQAQATEAAPATVAVRAGEGHGAPPGAKRARSGNWDAREGMYYQRNWGVEFIGLRRVASGYMLRLNFRVIDPAKAKPLFDKKIQPYVIDSETGARLAVPALENIGELRQTGKPVAGRNYFMIFGNPSRLVQPGAQVSIVLGNLHVDGFFVD